jgi:hypothetical protein
LFVAFYSTIDLSPEQFSQIAAESESWQKNETATRGENGDII